MTTPEIQAAIDTAVTAKLQAITANAEAKIKEVEFNYKQEIERLKIQLNSMQAQQTTVQDNEDKPTGIKKIVLDKSSTLKPDSFENESKGKLFRHWAKEYKNWIGIIDKDTKILLEWAEKFGAKKIGMEELKQGVRDTPGNLDKSPQEIDAIFERVSVQNGYLHFTLMSSTDGEAKETVRSCEDNGVEAWRELNYRWNRKTTFGATQVAELVRKVTQAKNVGEIYGKINQLSQLYLEYEKHSEEIKDANGKVMEERQLKYHEVFKKSDLLRVVPEEVNKFLKRDGIDLETEAYQSLLDRVQTYIRNNSKGQADMDLNNFDIKGDEGESDEKSSDQGPHEYENNYNADEGDDWGQANYMGEKGGKGKGYGKGGKGHEGKGYPRDGGFKGKGDKGFGKGEYFNGECGFCGKWGHKRSQCRSLTSVMKGKGKGYPMYGAKGYGKGYTDQKGKGKGVYNLGSSSAYAQHPQSYQHSQWADSYPPLMNVQQQQQQQQQYNSMMNMQHNSHDQGWNAPTFLCHLEEKIYNENGISEPRKTTLNDWIVVKEKRSNQKKRQNKKDNKAKDISTQKVDTSAITINNKFASLDQSGENDEGACQKKVDKDSNDMFYQSVEELEQIKLDNARRIEKKKAKKITVKQKLIHVEPECDGCGDNQCNYFAHADTEEQGVCCPLEDHSIASQWETLPAQWEKITILVDSGATENVANKDVMKGYKILKNSASEAGLTYTTANGKEIQNLGEKVVVVATSEGASKSIKFQICEVTKCLASVSRIVEAGHRVIFDIPEAGSYIENRRTGERTYLRQDRGLYLLDAWVMPCQEGRHEYPFQGQGARP